MSTAGCSARAEDLLLFAAGALERSESDAVRAHLDTGCAHCERELALARETLAALPLALEPRPAPPGVKDRLLRRVGEEEKPSRRSASPIVRRWRLPLTAAAAAALTLFAASQWWVAPAVELAERHAHDLERLRTERLSIEDDVEELEVSLEEARAAARRAELEVRLLRSPKLEAVDLRGTGRFLEASARIFWDYEDYLCYVHVRGLEARGEGERYVLWVFDEGDRRIPVGELAPDFDGEATLFAELPRDFGRIVRSVVTEEPRSREPTDALGPVALHWDSAES